MSTPKGARTLIQNSRGMCQAGEFNLHKFVCSDESVTEAVPAEAIQTIPVDQSIGPPITRTLGIERCLCQTALSFPIMLSERPPIRRGILLSISSVYDPLGLVTIFALMDKMILASLVQDGKQWDDPIDSLNLSHWKKRRSEIPKLRDLKVPRCYKDGDKANILKMELHHFRMLASDAYGQCLYLRIVTRAGKVSTRLVMAQSQEFVPAKATTIPSVGASSCCDFNED